MRYYIWRQNNSGGRFIGHRYVAVLADSLEDAKYTIGCTESPAYFNGVVLGIDCECCGDRWWTEPDYHQDITEELPEDVLVLFHDYA